MQLPTIKVRLIVNNLETAFEFYSITASRYSTQNVILNQNELNSGNTATQLTTASGFNGYNLILQMKRHKYFVYFLSKNFRRNVYTFFENILRTTAQKISFNLTTPQTMYVMRSEPRFFVNNLWYGLHLCNQTTSMSLLDK
ncbi:hypothetical protein EGR_02870 [Echinococcus granulosus]|uniref:Uncharacterized protein n=1 Tax=Echinococcus granulosus TaxID=6210 RepID=W6UVI6_ECHGR|nr:hypothetical protein EGR_02870 [Echinococcus granulosus]EUB62417.1 hypothetical protein EGR_02870 [Echinococcus granulosus]